ncbi:hypothetical protein ACRYHF_00095 [Stutzerimonas balearica]|uniref:hypothetical protein n=1 Tax=Stutzerimonas balearica TaxID=74829 RepID=UPI003F5B6100
MPDRISSRLPARTQRLLLEALLEHYPGEIITGYLVNATVSCNCVQGHAYRVRRYPEHAVLTSGEISQVVRYGARWLIHTVDFDCFVIVNFAPGGLQSLRHLIDLYETARMVQSRWCLQ